MTLSMKMSNATIWKDWDEEKKVGCIKGDGDNLFWRHDI
jgi:hypothetical protein